MNTVQKVSLSAPHQLMVTIYVPYYCICCGSILSWVQILFSFVSNSLSHITIPRGMRNENRTWSQVTYNGAPYLPVSSLVLVVTWCIFEVTWNLRFTNTLNRVFSKWFLKTTFLNNITELFTPKWELGKIFWRNKQEFKRNERIKITFPAIQGHMFRLARDMRGVVCKTFILTHLYWREGGLLHFLHHPMCLLDR